MDLPFFKIAQNLNIASSTAHRIYKRFEETGEVEGKKPQSRENLRKLSVRDELFIIGLILGNPVLYLEEICREVDKVLGKQVSAPTVCRLLAGYGFTRKKVQAIAKQRSDKFRGAFIAEMHCYSRDQLVWVDEMGCDRRDYVRRYGHALRGQVPVCHRLLHRGQRYSSIAALSSEGIVAVESHTGSTNADNFADFVRGSLIPQLHSYDGESPRSVVIMDNCTIHHTHAVLDLFTEAGIVVIFLPPYLPDLNPVEETFSYIKYYLKQNHELLEVLLDPTPVIKAAFDSVTPQLAGSWITDCGYQ